MYFFGMLRDSFADTVRVLPLPVAPTQSIFVSLVRRYSINAALRTLSIVGIMMSVKYDISVNYDIFISLKKLTIHIEFNVW